MAHDVFISYASPDKVVADAICNKLESNNIRTWIAPRDVIPGKDWAEAIMDGIAGSRILVMVFSKFSNESDHIKREIARAVHLGLHVISFRIDDVPMSKSLEYFVSTSHWLDALTTPIKIHIEKLSRTIEYLMSEFDARHDGKTEGFSTDQSEVQTTSDLNPAEQMVMQQLRGKPDIQWTIKIIEQSIKRNRIEMAGYFSQIRNSIHSLIDKGFLEEDDNHRISVGVLGVQYYRDKEKER